MKGPAATHVGAGPKLIKTKNLFKTFDSRYCQGLFPLLINSPPPRRRPKYCGYDASP